MARKVRQLSKAEEEYYNQIIAELPMFHDGSGQSWMRNPLPEDDQPIKAEVRDTPAILKDGESSYVRPSSSKENPDRVRVSYNEGSSGGDGSQPPVLVDANLPSQHYDDVPESTLRCNAFSLFFHKLWWGFLTLITLGIAYPWIICKEERFFAKRTKTNGHQLAFEGKGSSLFGHYMLWFLFTIITLGIFYFWLEQRIFNWKAKRMTFEGANEELEGGYNGSAIILALLRLAWALLSIVTLGIAYPATKCWEAKYIASHTRFKGRQMSFNGRGIQLFGRLLLCGLLTIVTLGIYGFWVPVKIRWWYTIHTHFADAPQQ